VKYYRFIVQLLIILSLGFSGIAIADTDNAQMFNDQQKQDIQQIIENYLLDNPEILIKMSQKLQAQQNRRVEDMEKQALATLPDVYQGLLNDSDSPTIGNPKGDVTLVEFFDFQCPHCKDMSPIVEGLVSNDNNLRVIYKPLPIFGGNSVFAAKAALAAVKQGKYKEFHDALMGASNPLTKDKVLDAAKSVGLNVKQLKTDIGSVKVSEELDNNLRLAQKLGIAGTPAYVVAASNYTSDKNKAFFVPGSTSSDTLNGMIVEVRNQ
jgi:protein-disulfide isomerase